MTGPAAVDTQTAEQRRACVRSLLRQPVVHEGDDPETLVLIRRHADWLRTFFDEQLGYRLTVEATHARLAKRPTPTGEPRPLRTAGGAAFDRRRYVLLCLQLAALERLGNQTVLSQLAEHVALLSADTPGVAPLDLDMRHERLAFVDAVRFLVEVGVLQALEGDDTRFAAGDDEADVLYSIRERLAACMLTCAVPPSISAGPHALDATYADTDAGRNRLARHRLMRRLLEEPVLYYDELDASEAAYVASQRHYLTSRIEEATGFEVEVRAEGIAVLDPAMSCTDVAFPTGGTVSHAALLLGNTLSDAGADGDVVPHARLRAEIDKLCRQHAGVWRSDVSGPAGRDRLLVEALDLLANLRLVDLTPEGVRRRPALFRYRDVTVNRPAPEELPL